MQRMHGRAELRVLPNVLSASRLLLAALFVPASSVWRAIIVVAAAVSDFLDGWIARSAKTSTRWGALIDPIGDRAFVVTAVVTFLVEGLLSTVGFLIFISRDLTTALGFLVARFVPALRGVTFRARWPGKIVTTLQLLTLMAILLYPAGVDTLIVLVAITSAWAITDYTLALWRARAR